MNPRPFYRSRLFWFGLPGLVFLLWAWSDSMTAGTHAWTMWKNSANSDSIMHHGGAAHVTHWPESFGGSLVPKRLNFSRQKRSDATDWFPRVEVAKTSVLGGGLHRAPRLVLPHWLLLVAYLLAWLLTLAWWHRRKTRMMKLHAAP